MDFKTISLVFNMGYRFIVVSKLILQRHIGSFSNAQTALRILFETQTKKQANLLLHIRLTFFFNLIFRFVGHLQ